MEKQNKKQINNRFTCKILLTRHGQTVQNKNKIICGQLPGQLTQSGITQAKKIGDYLFKTKKTFDLIYVSDLGRTKATYQNILSKAKHLQGIPIKYQKIIRQKSGGILTGKSLSSWDVEAKKQNKLIREYKCKEGQSWQDVNLRVKQFLKMLAKDSIQFCEKTNQKQLSVLVVCHGGYIMQFYNVYRELVFKQKPRYQNSALNCSIHQFELVHSLQQKLVKIQNIQMKCLVSNFVDHLK